MSAPSKRRINSILKEFGTYAFAIVLVAFTLVVHRLIQLATGAEFGPGLLLVLTIVAASWYGGWGPGLLATGLSAGYIIMLYASNDHVSLDLQTARLIGALLLVFVGTLLSGVMARLRRLQSGLSQRIEEQQAFVNIAPIGIAIAPRNNTRPITLNAAAMELLGTTATTPLTGEQIASGNTHFKVKRDGALLVSNEDPIIASLSRCEAVRSVEIDLEAPNGAIRHVLVQSAPLFAPNGDVRGCLAVFIDLTQRRRAELLLHEREQELVDFVENAPVGLHWLSPEGHVIWANRAQMEMLGYKHDEYIGRHLSEIHTDSQVAQGILDALTQNRELRNVEATLRRKDGEIRQVIIDCHVYQQNGRLIHSCCFIRDVSERRRIDEALRKSEEEFRTIFELAAVGKAQVDLATGRILRVNQRLATILSTTQPELLQRDVLDLASEDDRDALAAHVGDLLSGSISELSVEQQWRTCEGRPHWIHLTATLFRETGRPTTRAIFSVQDISTRKLVEAEFEQYRERLQELVAERTAELRSRNVQLRSSERMASLGTLSAGLGHDMGNLLLPVRLRLEAMEMKGIPDHLKDDVEAIGQCAEYLRRLASGLRQLSLDPNQTGGMPDRTNLADWWNDIESFLNNTLPRDVELERVFDDDLPDVLMPKHRLTQAVFNLVQNAGDAIGPNAAGHVRVFARRVSQNGVIEIGVADDGPGMSPEVKARCLEPFFTSKTRGLSTGLGLSLVHGIVQRAGGQIQVESEPGHGTTFTLQLLAAPAPVTLTDSHLIPSTSIQAHLSLADLRLQTYIEALLRALEIPILASLPVDDVKATLWITDVPSTSISDMEQFLAGGENRCVVAIGRMPQERQLDRVVNFTERPRPAVLRDQLREIIKQLESHAEDVANGVEDNQGTLR